MKLFAITTLREDERDPGGIRARTVGVFLYHNEKPNWLDGDSAASILENDLGALNEDGYYPWAVIEQIETELYPHPELLQCYEYNKGWKPVEPPPKIKEYLEKIIGFCSIG